MSSRFPHILTSGSVLESERCDRVVVSWPPLPALLHCLFDRIFCTERCEYSYVKAFSMLIHDGERYSIPSQRILVHAVNI